MSDGISRLRRVRRRQSAGLFDGHVGQEIQAKGPVGADAHVRLSNERHAEDIAVEVETLDGVLHANHGLRESKFVVDRRFLVARHDLDPVAIGVQCKGQAYMTCLVSSDTTRFMVDMHLSCGLHLASSENAPPQTPTRRWRRTHRGS